MEFVYIISVIVWGIIWGYVAESVIRNKGYEEEGKKFFWLGFFFSFIPVIIAATRQNKYSIAPIQKPANNALDDLEKLAKLKEQGVLTEGEYAKLKTDCLNRM